MTESARHPRGLLHHVELYVADLARSTEFWSFLLGELGYTLYQEWEQGRSYLLGDTYIVLVQTESPHLEPAYHRKRTGLNHLAFHGGSREAVDALATTLRARGVPMLYDDQYPYANGEPYFAVFCEDPDRMKVEITADQP